MPERGSPLPDDAALDADERSCVSGIAVRGRPIDSRILAAWREWLAALATDAEAAMAASHVYGELDPEARNAWLDALAEDGPSLAVPPVAIYAPLLAMEADPARRARIAAQIGDDAASLGWHGARALWGIGSDGTRLAALVAPLYLRFVRVLWCRYSPYKGFTWVKHDPILREGDVPQPGASISGVTLEETPLSPVVEELAHAILAQRRSGRAMPHELQLFADLFDARVEHDALP